MRYKTLASHRGLERLGAPRPTQRQGLTGRAGSLTEPRRASVLAGLAALLAASLLTPRTARAAAPEPITEADAAAWCETACKEPVRPTELTRTVTSQKMVGGRLVTVESEVESPEVRRYEDNLTARFALSEPYGAGGCAALCSCAVLGTQKSLKALGALKPLALVLAMGKVKAGPETWHACACRKGPTCSEAGACLWGSDRCVAAAPADCEASTGCTQGGRCSLVADQCVIGKDADCERTAACAAEGLCSARDGLCVVGKAEHCAVRTECTALGWCTPAGRVCGPDGTPAGFVAIPPGTFTMGSPSSEEGRDSDEVQHTVTLTRAFWLQATEVTQGQWEAVMGTNPSYNKSCGKDCPVENVSWFDAVAYLNALSKREGLQPCYTMTGCSGRAGGGCGSEVYCTGDYQCSGVAFVGLGCSGYRLPTEAEWEYAARAGTTAARYGALDAVGWYDANSGNTTHRVATKQANAWGLHDMLGNVWEWVQDWHAEYPSGAVSDPQGPASGVNRVYRGGSWFDEARLVRAADRFGGAPANRYDGLGLRAARSVP
jgi:formylglycine-generating enzyme required for sulfatase activity